MFKGKESGRVDGQPAGSVGSKGSGAVRSALVLLLLITLVLGLSGAAIFLLERQQAHQADLSRLRLLAGEVAQRLAGHITIYTAILEKQTHSQALADLLRKQEQGLIQEREKRLVQVLPEVQRMLFLPPDPERSEPERMKGMNFATLDMFRQIERTGKPVAAEVHQFGTGREYIAIAAPIVDARQVEVVGVSLLSLSFEPFKRMLDTADNAGGYFELQQLAGDGSVALLQSRPDPVDGAMDGSVRVPGAIWRVAYWRKDGNGALGLLWSPVVLTVALAIIGALVLLCGLRLRRALRQDGSAILELTREILAGNAIQHLPPIRFPELQEASEKLARLRPGSGSVGRARETGREQVVTPSGKDAGGSAERVAPMPAAQIPAMDSGTALVVEEVPPESIFRAYDIRGVVGDTLTAADVEIIGQAIGSEAAARDQQTVIVAHDGRNSSLELSDALCRGLVASGRAVVDLGLVPTPVLYFATHFLGSNSGVMVTGSHNPAEYNGLKIVIDGEALFADGILGLRQRIIQGNLQRGQGRVQQQDLVPDYIARITDDIQLLRPLKLVVDCGNGAASVIAPMLFRTLGCDVVDLFCEVDGNFPNHHPDPGQPENMQSLIAAVRDQSADLGVAFDGDGDRLGVVDSNGRIIWPDRLLMLLARDVLMRNPGADVIYDVKSSRHLAGEILTYGGRPIMWQSGHSLIKAKLRETGALLAGEMSGHIFLQERWFGFDDGLYACARVLEVLSAEGVSSAEVFSLLPESTATPELGMPVPEGTAVQLVQRFIDQGAFPESKQITIDGVRVEFGDGWGLARPSNTTSAVTFRFEADDQAAMERIEKLFRKRFLAIDPGLKLPF